MTTVAGILKTSHTEQRGSVFFSSGFEITLTSAKFASHEPEANPCVGGGFRTTDSSFIIAILTLA